MSAVRRRGAVTIGVRVALVSALLLAATAAATTADAATRRTTTKKKPTTKASTKATTTTTVAPTTTAPLTSTTVAGTAAVAAGASSPLMPVPRPASSLAFTSCGSKVECANAPVPFDPADPGGEQITLFVSRRPANDAANRLGVLFVNPGGPGDPAFDLVRNVSLVVSTEILDRYDVIGVDPRGTQRSSPITCNAPLDPVPRSSSAAERVRGQYASLAKACATEGRRLEFLDTPTAARDLDAVRAALGEDRISFLGLSYGTYLGATYERLFPQHSARMILDSAITPENFGAEMLVGRAAAKELALDGFLTACANGQLAPCNFNDGTDLRAKYLKVRSDYATAQGLLPGQGEQVFDAQIDGLVGYPRNGWPILGRALQEIATTGRGNFRQTAADAQSSDDRERVEPADTFSDLANLAINCRDGILPREADAFDTLVTRIASTAPRFSGIAVSMALAALTCANWPAARLELPTLVPVGVPTLVLANRFDLTTPLAWSQRLAADLQAPLLVREGGGHVASDKSDCVRAAVARFLIDATPGLATTSCPG